MGTDVKGNGPFSPSDVDPTKFGSGGRSYAPNQGYTAAPAILHQLLQRIAFAMANTAALQATVEADRKDGMVVVTLDTYTIWVWEDASAAGADSTHIEPTDTAAGSGLGRFVAVATTPQTLGNLGIQTGSGVLTAGASGNVAATITASSKVFVTRTAVNASTTLGELAVTNKTIGAPGHFVVDAETVGTPATPQAGDASSFDWMVVG
jgi:hypothetical protein